MVQFSGNRKGAPECRWIVTWDRQLDYLKGIYFHVSLLRYMLICGPARIRKTCLYL